ncbi:MAG TPA: DUF2059 domain-containing protein [Allosphingosinicella sp.]
MTSASSDPGRPAKRDWRAWVAALALALLVPAEAPRAAQGAAAEAPDAAVDPRLERVRELVRLTTPHDALLASNMAGWEAALRHRLSLDPRVMQLERQYPGLVDAGVEAARPSGRRQAQDFVRRAVEIQTAVFAESLAPPELDKLIQFYSSPLGQAALRRSLGALDPAAIGRQMATELAQTGKAQMTAQEAQALERVAAERMFSTFSAADRQKLSRFLATREGRKFQEVMAKANRRLLEIVNNPDRRAIDEGVGPMVAAMRAHVEARTSRKP